MADEIARDIETTPAPAAQVAGTLSDGKKIKVRLPRMRACDEKNEKGKLCAGHLKRWFNLTEEVAAKYGTKAEIYRCERCRTIYLPNPDEAPRSGTLSY